MLEVKLVFTTRKFNIRFSGKGALDADDCFYSLKNKRVKESGYPEEYYAFFMKVYTKFITEKKGDVMYKKTKVGVTVTFTDLEEFKLFLKEHI